MCSTPHRTSDISLKTARPSKPFRMVKSEQSRWRSFFPIIQNQFFPKLPVVPFRPSTKSAWNAYASGGIPPRKLILQVPHHTYIHTYIILLTVSDLKFRYNQLINQSSFFRKNQPGLKASGSHLVTTGCVQLDSVNLTYTLETTDHLLGWMHPQVLAIGEVTISALTRNPDVV